MANTKKNIITDEFEGKPTRFGKIVVGTAQNESNQMYWDELYDTFLNMPFWIPMVIRNKGTKKESYYPVLAVQKSGKQNLVIFEKKARLAEWHKNNIKKVGEEVMAAQYDSGYDVVKKLPLALLKEHDLYIDFGKSIFLIFKPEKTLWLRKVAAKLEE